MGKESPESWKRRNARKAEWKRKIDPSTVPLTITRSCKDCGELKECRWDYTFSQTGKPEYNTRCIECSRVYSAKNQRNRSKNRNEYRRKKIIERKRKAVEYLGGSCSRCGYNKSLVALTFHHRNPEEKENTIGALREQSWDKLKEELDKCDLLCFNCHMELHAEENELNSSFTRS
jgi:hypothetical protein